MKTYIALLRGINVSGQKKIRMADLRVLMEELGFDKVTTYIQSGNIIFRFAKKEIPVLEKMIAHKIRESYGFDVSVLIRTPDELLHVLNHNPHISDREKDIKRVYVTFLAEIPQADRVNEIEQSKYLPEEFIADGKVLYGYSPEGYGKAKMNNNFFESKLKVGATTRNWNTVRTLYDMTQNL